MAMSKTREQFPLSPKKIVKKTLAATIGWIIVFLFVFGISGFAIVAAQNGAVSGILSFVIVGALVLLLVIVILTYLYQTWYYNVYSYDLTSDYVIIKKGPITPHEITIPYERIQDVYVDQDLLDRIMGLYDVHISSATISSGMAAHIDGVEGAAADGLKAALLETVSRKISRNRTNIEPSGTPSQ